MSPVGRRLATAFLLFHLLMMAGSLLVHTSVGAAIRRVTGPYERFAGLYQGWDMFAPNAPRVTTWIEAVGLTAAGKPQPLPPLSTEPDPIGLSYRYQRRDKLGRNLAGEHRMGLRKSAADWYCHAALVRGEPLKKVSLVAVRRKTPSPRDRRSGVEAAPTRETLLERRCR